MPFVAIEIASVSPVEPMLPPFPIIKFTDSESDKSQKDRSALLATHLARCKKAEGAGPPGRGDAGRAPARTRASVGAMAREFKGLGV